MSLPVRVLSSPFFGGPLSQRRIPVRRGKGAPLARGRRPVPLAATAAMRQAVHASSFLLFLCYVCLFVPVSSCLSLGFSSGSGHAAARPETVSNRMLARLQCLYEIRQYARSNAWKGRGTGP